MTVQKKMNAGFTLIEVMVVVVIIAILAVAVVPRVINRPDQARVVKAHSDVLAIENALNLYRLDNGSLPTQEQGLAALVHVPTLPPLPQNWQSGGYLKSLPKDPWGKAYQYSNPGQHGDFDVFSFGADGEAGGTDLDADIGNWQDG